jgi:hypothetical protein
MPVHGVVQNLARFESFTRRERKRKWESELELEWEWESESESEPRKMIRLRSDGTAFGALALLTRWYELCAELFVSDPVTVKQIR